MLYLVQHLPKDARVISANKIWYAGGKITTCKTKPASTICWKELDPFNSILPLFPMWTLYGSQL